MRREDIKTDWDYVHENLSMKWSKLYNVEFPTIGNQKEELIKELEKQYGLSRKQAVKEVASFYNSWVNRTFI